MISAHKRIRASHSTYGARVLIALLLDLAISTTVVLPVAFAATVTTQSGDSISTDKPSYVGNSTIVISGSVEEAKDNTVTVTITNPSGSEVASAHRTADEDNGAFTVTFTAGGPAWNTGGTYTATVVYLLSQLETIAFNATFTYTPAQTNSSVVTATLTHPTNVSAPPGIGGTSTIVAGVATTVVAVLLIITVMVLRRQRITHSSMIQSLGTRCDQIMESRAILEGEPGDDFA